MFKTHKLIIISTKKESKIQKSYYTGTLYYNPLIKKEDYEYQHIYILSDEVIKENDWCYNTKHKTISKIDGNAFRSISWVSDNLDIYFKIIATSDESLNLPIIPSQFIKEFIFKIYQHQVEVETEYVKIEYTSIDTNEDQLSVPVNYEELEEIFIPKTKNNYLTNIQFIKINWTREEMLNILNNFGYFVYGCGNQYNEALKDKWIKDNL